MIVAHVNSHGDLPGGTEVYLRDLLSAPTSSLTHRAVALHGGEVRWAAGCEFAILSRDGADRVRRLLSGADLIVVHTVAASLALAGWRREEGGGATGGVRDPPVVRFVHDHSWYCPSGTRLHAAGARGRGTICDIRASSLACAARYYPRRCGGLDPRRALEEIRRANLARRGTRSHAGTLVASEAMRELVCRHGERPDRALTVGYLTGLASERDPLDPRRRDIVFAGRLTSVKGWDVLLKAYAMLRHPAPLVMAGTGIDAARLAAAVRRHPRSDRIRLLPILDRDGVRALLEEAVLLALPSRWPEPFGIAGLEAMACNVPVVASDVGGVREWLVPEETGVAVPPGQPEALAKALDRLLHDPALRARFAGAGRDRVEREFRAAAHLARLTTAVQQLLRAERRT